MYGSSEKNNLASQLNYIWYVGYMNCLYIKKTT